MYIRELQVEGYGALQDLKMAFDSPITVVYGPNEAGKSTLLRFIRSLLYGFPTRKDPVERGEPARGGRHGGRLLLADRSGREWQLERFAEKGSGLTLRDAEGAVRTMQQAEWERQALGGVSERLFRQLFSVSLDELHELRALQGEEIGNYLYHAGLAGGAALTSARKRLGAEMDRLYRPKGSTQDLNKLLASIKEAEAEIRQSRDDVQYFNDTIEALRLVERKLADLDLALPVLRAEVAELHGAHDLRETWLKLRTLEAEEAEVRSALPNPDAGPLPESVNARWPALRQRRLDAAEQADKAAKAARQLASDRDALVWNEALAEACEDLERLDSRREAIAAKRKEAAELEAEHRMLADSAETALRRISPDWSGDDLRAFGGLTSEREQARRIRAEREEAERAAEALHADIRKLARGEEALSGEGDAALEEASRPSAHVEAEALFVPRTREALLQAWHDLEDELRRYERARSAVAFPPAAPIRLPSGRRASRSAGKKPGSPALIYIGAAALALLAVALPFAVGGGSGIPPALAALSAVLAVSAGGLALTAYRRQAASSLIASAEHSAGQADEAAAAVRVHGRQVAERLRQLLRHSEAAAAKLIADGEESDGPQAEEAFRHELRQAVHERLALFDKEETRRTKRQELARRRQELRAERELLEQDLASVGHRLEEIEERWRAWLRDRKLPSGLLPDLLPDLFHLAEQAHTAHSLLNRTAEKLSAAREAIRQFEAEAEERIAKFPVPAAIASDAVAAAQWLYRDAVKQREVKEEAVRADKRLEAARAAIEEAEQAEKEASDAIASLLAEAKASDEEDLERRLVADERSRGIRQQAREARLRLEAGRDERGIESLYGLLKSRDEFALAAALKERAALLDAEERGRTELLDRRGRLSEQLERLRAEAEQEDRSQRLREQTSKLEADLERYAVLAIADRLITKAKAVFEEEKQPEVLKQASRFLKQMTGGKYVRVTAPGDSPALIAETADRTALDSLFLSRGTQEQLYLAMRFALCDAASKEHPLPLLLDDLFVHFDEERLNCAVPVLEELSGTRQVLLFTCHRHVARTVVAGTANARALVLPERGGAVRPAALSDLG